MPHMSPQSSSCGSVPAMKLALFIPGQTPNKLGKNGVLFCVFFQSTHRFLHLVSWCMNHMPVCHSYIHSERLSSCRSLLSPSAVDTQIRFQREAQTDSSLLLMSHSVFFSTKLSFLFKARGGGKEGKLHMSCSFFKHCGWGRSPLSQRLRTNSFQHRFSISYETGNF